MKSKAAPGSIYGVRLPNGRYCACILVLRQPASGVAGSTGSEWSVVVLEGNWEALPSIETFRTRRMLKELTFLAWPVRAIVTGDPPRSFIHIGSLSPTDEEKGCVGMGSPWLRNWEDFAASMFLEWRRRHDAAALHEELCRKDRATRAARAKAKRRKVSRRNRLTLAALKQLRPFTAWKRLWGREVVQKAQAIYRETVSVLPSLDAEPDPENCRTVVRQMVARFNELEAEQHCIESEERDEIIEVLDDLLFTVGLPDEDLEELTADRNW